ncbi:MAG TPA: glycosyltransferase family 4 protein, partial [Allosphingosinicella sp.]
MLPCDFLHIFGTFDHGGAEARTLDLMRGFGARATHTVLVADQAALGARLGVSPELSVCFPKDESRSVSGHPTLARLLRLARLMQPHDLILTYGWGGMDFVMARRLFSRMIRLPALVHHEDGTDPHRSGARGKLRHAYRRFALRGASRVVVPSRSLPEVALTDWKVPPDILKYIPNGIRLDPKACRGTETANSAARRMPGETVVVCVAGLRPEKNLPRLVRAAALAGTDIRLVIVGEGPEREVVTAEARKWTFEHQLDMIGFVADVPNYLAAADIFALSSDTEQCPLSVMEAMAAGLPVVAPSVGDIESMVSEANRPFIVPPNDEERLAAAIRRLADDPALCTAIGASNADRARSHYGSAGMIDA